MRLSSLCLALGAGAVAISCGSIGGGGGSSSGQDAGLDGLVEIRVEPGAQTLVIEGDTPATSTYAAVGVFEDGSERDITGDAIFTLARPALGAFTGPDFSSGTEAGGVTAVEAAAAGMSGRATLTLVLKKTTSDSGSSGLPADPGSLFGGAEDPARAPEGVYPNDGVLVPPNLKQLEFHFYPGESNTVFELSLQNDVTDVTVYLECATPLAEGCVYTPAPEVWRWIAETNRGGRVLSWQVRGTDESGSAFGSSAASELSFSQDNIEGGIYYWTTTDDTAIMRFDFASEDQTEAELFISTEMTGGSCVGCHALSRDGTKMVTASSGSTGADVLLLEVGTRSPMVPYASTPRSAFSSWSPDGDRFVGVYGGTASEPLSYDLNLFDGQSGAYLESIDVGGTDSAPANHPDWSPAGDQIVYTKVGSRNGSSLAQHVYTGAIEMVTAGGAGWSAPEVLIPADEDFNHYYPTFAPDGEIVAFNRSRCENGETTAACDAYEDRSARLFFALPEAGATPVEAERANAPGVTDEATELKTSFPKWSPFVFQRTAEIGSRLMWITFSSTRQYGLRAPPDGTTWIWMAAVDPDRVADGVDPSFPAFALPFQDLATSNHTAQWTTQVVDVD